MESLNVVVLGAAQIFGRSYRAFANAAPPFRLYGVASREKTRAEDFLACHQARFPIAPPPRAYGSYQEAIDDPAVGGVYIPLPTKCRKQWVLEAARAGKHVLTEKPGGANAAEVREMIEACKTAGVQFMDNTMLMHSQRRAKFEKAVREIGTLKSIDARFSFLADDSFRGNDIRLNSDLELGCPGDLSWYNYRGILLSRRWMLPEVVSSRTVEVGQSAGSPAPVVATFESTLQFRDGVTAHEYSSFLSGFVQRLEVFGEEGHLLVDDYVLPCLGSEVAFDICRPVFSSDGQVERHDCRVSVTERSQGEPESQDTRTLNRFAELALSGEPDDYWGRATLLTQLVLDACLESAREGKPVRVGEP